MRRRPTLGPTVLAVALSLLAVGCSPGASPTPAPRTTTTTPPAPTNVVPPAPVTWGPARGPRTLVLYDAASDQAGELYAESAGNLATHFGPVTAEPVTAYRAGDMRGYTAVVYIGSTYNEPIPAAFLADVRAGPTPVIWIGFNVWELDNTGAPAAASFERAYGWDPSTSYLDADRVTAVTYKGQTLTRSPLNSSQILGAHITNAGAVTILASAVCPSRCQSQARSQDGTTFPWAIRSRNLTYIAEIPFDYVGSTDRYLIYSDLLFHALAPATPVRHRALLRLEDVNATYSPSQLTAIADWLHGQHIPFSVDVIPYYVDPKGYYTRGRPQSIHLYQAPAFVAALRHMIADGGSLNMEGYTHQYSTSANPMVGALDNPYDGVSGDDFEFYRARCSTTQHPPYHFQSPCRPADWVVEVAPVSNDSASWALGRIDAGIAEFRRAGLPVPGTFVFPHYAASATDYEAVNGRFHAFYERRLYFASSLAGGRPSPSHAIGQFFPYPVRDIYGASVIPEDLGNYEPKATNHNPPRTIADILHEATLEQVVRDAYASFYYDPFSGLAPLQTIVRGLVSMGYQFVGPSSLVPGA